MTYSLLDQAKGGAGSSQFGGMQALSAEQLAALSSIHVDPSILPYDKAVLTADAVIAQQTAALANTAGDPVKTGQEGKGGKGGKGKKSPPPPPMPLAELEQMLPKLGRGPLTPPEAKAQAKRDELLGQIRSAKEGGQKQRRLINKWNTFMPARNAARYP